VLKSPGGGAPKKHLEKRRKYFWARPWRAKPTREVMPAGDMSFTGTVKKGVRKTTGFRKTLFGLGKKKQRECLQKSGGVEGC